MEMLADFEDREEDLNPFFKEEFYVSDLGENYRSSNFNISFVKWENHNYCND